MALPEVNALSDRIEQLTTLADPAERDRALSSMERDLKTLLSRVATYRGDTQVQLHARQMGPPEESDPEKTSG